MRYAKIAVEIYHWSEKDLVQCRRAQHWSLFVSTQSQDDVQPLCTQLSACLFVCFQDAPDGPGQAGEHYLVCAPTPGGQDCEPKNETWPRNVPIHRVTEHVKGIGPWEVTGGVGNCGIGNGLHI